MLVQNLLANKLDHPKLIEIQNTGLHSISNLLTVFQWGYKRNLVLNSV